MPPLSVVDGPSANVSSALPALELDPDIPDNSCYVETFVDQMSGRGGARGFTMKRGHNIPAWIDHPRLFIFVEDLTPANATYDNSNFNWAFARLARPRSGFKWNTQQCVNGAQKVAFSDLNDQDAAGDCGDTLLGAFNILKDSSTCHDPLGVSEYKPPNAAGYHFYNGGITAPGGWMMMTQRSDVDNADIVGKSSGERPQQKYFHMWGSAMRRGPARLVIAVENPGYSFASTNFGLACAASHDEFWRRRSPFAMSMRLEIQSSPGHEDGSEDRSWSDPRGTLTYTNHFTNEQVIYSGANFTQIMRSGNEMSQFMIRFESGYNQWCSPAPSQLENWQPVPSGFWKEES